MPINNPPGNPISLRKSPTNNPSIRLTNICPRKKAIKYPLISVSALTTSLLNCDSFNGR